MEPSARSIAERPRWTSWDDRSSRTRPHRRRQSGGLRRNQSDARKVVTHLPRVSCQKRPVLRGGVSADEEVGEYARSRPTAIAVAQECLSGEKQRRARNWGVRKVHCFNGSIEIFDPLEARREIRIDDIVYCDSALAGCSDECRLRSIGPSRIIVQDVEQNTRVDENHALIAAQQAHDLVR